ncbi:hypothetical protein [Shewanella phage SFCi1]|nr:hypothetical protein [Shewanella phage SFCi1]
MPNMTVTNRSLTGIVIFGAVFEDEILTATGAETWPAGAVLARVTASGKLVRLDTGGADGSEVPLAVLTTPVEFTAAGDRTERPAIAGRVRRGDLVDSADAALSDEDIDTLRSYGVIAQVTHELTELDNQ